jgi:hypothetical protein
VIRLLRRRRGFGSRQNGDRKEEVMAEEIKTQEVGTGSQIGKYVRWIFLGAIGSLLVLTVIMAVIRRFGEG